MALFGGKAKPAKFSAPRAITAAAAPVRLRDKPELEKLRLRNATAHAWQREAWRVYDALGEVNFACNLVGNALSRVRIHAAVVMNADEPPVEVTDGSSIEVDGVNLGAKGGIDPRLAVRARELVAQLGKGQGIPSMLKAYALNQQVAGECYLTLINQKWSIKSTFELLVDPGATMRIQPSMTTQNALPEEIPTGSTVARMWSQHPMYSSDPDCQLRAVLFLCEQLILLNRMINNTVRSRMNAGILKVAASIIEASRTPGAEGNVDDPEVEEVSGFEADLHAVMTQPIADDAAAGGVIPMVAVVPDELVGPGIEHIQLARDVDQHMLTYAENVLTRILNGINIPKNSITGFQNVRYCVDDATEALTRDGWVHRSDLRVGDDIFTLDHETGLAQWERVLAVNEFAVVDEPMLSIEGEGHSSLTTGGHRWPIVKKGKKVSGSRRRWTTSDGGFSFTDLIPAAAELGETPVDAKYTDDFVRLLALYTSDGCRVDAPRGRPWISIGKSQNHPMLETIRGILTRLYGPAVRGQGVDRSAWNEYTDDHQQRVIFRLNVDASEDVFAVAPDRSKAVPLDFVHALTRAQLDLYLESFVELGDGHKRTADSIQTYQTDESRLESLALAAVLTGRVVRWAPVPGRDLPKGYYAKPAVRLLISKHRLTVAPKRLEPEWTTYTGTVWCPTTATGTWFARRDGKVFFTGNSNAQQITEDLYTQAVEPLALSFVDNITEIFLRPILRADAVSKGWDPEQVEKVVVWYDPSDVVTRPDRGADADAGWDRGALSDDAWRQAHAFSADDAPSVEERLMRLLVQNPQLPPNLIDYLARELLPSYFKAAPPLVTKAQAGMVESQAATSPLAKARAEQNGGTVNEQPTQFPAGSQDQDVPAGGTLPPRTP